ncbi:hypothetical protein [Streptomyces sp. DT171]|uniref:hypothetical protein n=1 Tax=Streptomyces sp. DT171 TaxID=3416524 RepID=UPI003CF3C4CC
MVAPVAGGSVLADFDTILVAAVPELSGRVRGVAFDADTSRMDVVPDAPAVGTQLRWSAPKLIAATNEKVPGANVRVLRVLAPASVRASPITAAATPVPQPTTAAAPVQRPDLPEDYREALEELRAKTAAQQRVRLSDASRARALQRLAAERTGLTTIGPPAMAMRRNRAA